MCAEKAATITTCLIKGHTSIQKQDIAKKKGVII